MLPAPPVELGPPEHDRSDRPQLVVRPEIGRRGAHLHRDRDARKCGKKAEDDEIDDEMGADPDPGIDGRLAVAADSIGVAPVNRVTQHEMREDREAEEDRSERRKRTDAARPEVRIGEVHRIEGLLLGVDEDQAPHADHCAERDDEGVNARLPDDGTVQRSDCHSGEESDADRRQDADDVLKPDGQAGGERQHGTDRKIDVAVDHDESHAKGDQPDRRGLHEDVDEVAGIEEVPGRQAEEDQDRDDEYPDRRNQPQGLRQPKAAVHFISSHAPRS